MTRHATPRNVERQIRESISGWNVGRARHRHSASLVALEVVLAALTTDVRPAVLLPVVDDAGLAQIRLELRQAAHLRELRKPDVHHLAALLVDRGAHRFERKRRVAEMAGPEADVAAMIRIACTARGKCTAKPLDR